jgi:hypothetical protein
MAWLQTEENECELKLFGPASLLSTVVALSSRDSMGRGSAGERPETPRHDGALQ